MGELLQLIGLILSRMFDVVTIICTACGMLLYVLVWQCTRRQDRIMERLMQIIGEIQYSLNASKVGWIRSISIHIWKFMNGKLYPLYQFFLATPYYSKVEEQCKAVRQLAPQVKKDERLQDLIFYLTCDPESPESIKKIASELYKESRLEIG